MKAYFTIILFLMLSLGLRVGHSEPLNHKKTKTICGTLADSNGEAIAGAAIKILETGEVIYTDLSGRYTLNLPTEKNTTLQLESIGYQALTIQSSGLSNFDVLILKEL